MAVLNYSSINTHRFTILGTKLTILLMDKHLRGYLSCLEYHHCHYSDRNNGTMY